MRRQGTLWVGIFLLGLGLVLLLGSIFRVSFWQYCWPIGLIVLGAWLLFRPRWDRPGAATRVVLLGDLRFDRFSGALPQDVVLLIGDVRLDLTGVELPLGETVIRIYSFIGDVRLVAPAGAGVSLSSAAFITDYRFMGSKQSSFFVPLNTSTPGYELAERKIALETFYFIGDTRVDQS